jgi:hypothetical protein
MDNVSTSAAGWLWAVSYRDHGTLDAVMDPWAPINGISLERYAELSAEITGENDKEKQLAIVAAQGVQRADWEAATAGWTARMQDMSLMGAVATRYMPLYNAALQKKSGGAPQVSFEDYVGMSGCVPVMGINGMYAHYKITAAQWTMISSHWTNTIPTNPQYQMFGMMVEQEAARIRNGGAPRPVNIQSGGAAPQAQPMANPYQQPNPYPQPQPYAQQPYPAQQPYYNQQAANAGAQMGNALMGFGNAVGNFFDSAIGSFAAGQRVMVQWSDGNRYPATVTNPTRNGQVEVAFPDGRRIWVPSTVVSATY